MLFYRYKKSLIKSKAFFVKGKKIWSFYSIFFKKKFILKNKK